MSVRCLALIADALLSLGLGQSEQVFKLINRLDRSYKRFIAFWKYVSTPGAMVDRVDLWRGGCAVGDY